MLTDMTPAAAGQLYPQLQSIAKSPVHGHVCDCYLDQSKDTTGKGRGFSFIRSSASCKSPGPAVRGKGSCQPLISPRQGQLLSLLPR
ncbi:hypothetical protein WN51_12958 [Melipona quadrifasciata]|uniref:Uncharacterized protein n=1 Tax=Melipona quadrifasciata TaxID=166423 RepID=A0A0M9AAC2_9HYME|nr:hypothetical protein WN51_12958 [Melipona quadrifasciata]